MKATVLNCFQFTLPKQCHWVDLLLFTTPISIFWILAVNNACLAQLNSSQQSNYFQLEEPLLVPQSPVPSGKPTPGLQTLPPPPGTSESETLLDGSEIAVTPKMKPLFIGGVQQTPADEIKQLENGFIQQTGKVPKAKSRAVPSSAAYFVPEFYRGTNVPLKTADTSIGQLNAQSPPILPLPNTTSTQEFTAPTTPTFNQLLSQPQSASLPPLPGNFAPTFNQQNSQVSSPPPFTGNSEPTFNQQLNSQATTPPVNSTPTSTFNILLSCQAVAPPSGVGTSGTFNILLNCQAVPPQSGVSTSPPNYNQFQNSQGGTLPSVVTTQTQRQEEFPSTPVPPTPQTTPTLTPPPSNQPRPLINSAALRDPSLRVQGVYVTQGDDNAARARLTGVYPLSPQVLFGATLDLLSGENLLVDSRGDGLNINELYVATSFSGLPNLRFVLGQIDLTSYFDRNSFAKDGASQFFNPVFQTNPALSATGIAPRPAFLVNWSVTDNIEAKAGVFSSSDKISDFSLDGFAGEVAIRYGNAIIRGTYSTSRDAGNRDTFPESFGIPRNRERTQFGPQEDDREEAYGVNAEVYIPNWKMGLFGRYGRYENRDLGEGADTYSFGLSFLDLFTPDDRLGLAYGRALSNDSLRRGDKPDVLELFYDFRFLPNLWLGFSLQERDNFEETVFGIRVRSEFDIVTPRDRGTR